MKRINWSDHLLNFLAVILGVSLAFFVNASSERKKQAVEYDEVINSFLEEFESDKDIFTDFQIPDNEGQVNTIAEILQMLQTDEIDSLSQKFPRAIGFNNYHPSNVTFNSLASSGKLDLIKDYALRKQLSVYHTILVKEAENRGKIQVEFYMNHLLPWLLKNTDFTKPDIEAIRDTELVNMLIIYEKLIVNKLRQYELLVSEISDLEQQLTELKTNSL